MSNDNDVVKVHLYGRPQWSRSFLHGEVEQTISLTVVSFSDPCLGKTKGTMAAGCRACQRAKELTVIARARTEVCGVLANERQPTPCGKMGTNQSGKRLTSPVKSRSI